MRQPRGCGQVLVDQVLVPGRHLVEPGKCLVEPGSTWWCQVEPGGTWQYLVVPGTSTRCWVTRQASCTNCYCVHSRGSILAWFRFLSRPPGCHLTDSLVACSSCCGLVTWSQELQSPLLAVGSDITGVVSRNSFYLVV